MRRRHSEEQTAKVKDEERPQAEQTPERRRNGLLAAPFSRICQVLERRSPLRVFFQPKKAVSVNAIESLLAATAQPVHQSLTLVQPAAKKKGGK